MKSKVLTMEEFAALTNEMNIPALDQFEGSANVDQYMSIKY